MANETSEKPEITAKQCRAKIYEKLDLAATDRFKRDRIGHRANLVFASSYRVISASKGFKLP